MAKEMKKSIIASDDEVDKHLCITDSEQTELSSILDTLSLGPTKENKKLLIFSPSGILLHRAHRKNRHMIPKNRCPDASRGPNHVYKRPFAQEFIKFCLERFEVGIWSSAWESNVDIILDIALEDLKDKLLFVWGQQQCTDTGLNTLKHKGRPLFFKDLSKVFQRFKEFSVLNTVFIDDEPDKALLNPGNTGVFPVTYDPLDKNDDFLDPEGEFCSYLNDLANSSDVQAYIRERSFGQPKIDSSHPDWSFYCKALEIVSNLT